LCCAAEVSFPEVDKAAAWPVKTNRYSIPLRLGIEPQVKVYPAYVEVWHEGRRVARHERRYAGSQQILVLEHYLEPLSRKPAHGGIDGFGEVVATGTVEAEPL
jgi:hypothetical protein